MGTSQDYPHVPEWVVKDTGYHTGEMVRYQNNIFIASYWAGQAPGTDPGWALYDELYDQTSHPATQPAKIIGYLPTWRKQERFNYSNGAMYQSITHGMIAFLTFNETRPGELNAQSVSDVSALVPQVVTTAHQYGTYISVSLGGATDYGFLNLLTAIGSNGNDPRLGQAVQNVVKFVTDNALDGVDLDLECWWDRNGDPTKDQGGRATSTGPHPAGTALTLFAQQLKQAMPDKLVSATLFATSWYGNNYDPKLAEHVDWVSIMTYDLTGSWNNSPVGPHTALHKIRQQETYAVEQQGPWPTSGGRSSGSASSPMVDNPIFSVEDSLWYWSNPFFVNWQGTGQKLARSKLVAGVPLYGYDFAYQKDPDPQSGQVPPGYKVIRYKDLVQQFASANTAANANIKVQGNTSRPPFVSAPGTYPYAHNIYFETPATAAAKLNFLQQIGVQGVIIWELSNEDWGAGRSIAQTLYQHSGNSVKRSPLPPPIIQRPLPPGLTGQASWSTEQPLRYGTTGSPALAVYQNKLYALHEGYNANGQLWYTGFDGHDWTAPNDTNTRFGTHGSPVLAVYQGKLYALHEGAREDAALWWTSFDGQNWSSDTNTGHGTTGPGALAVFRNKLYCVHPGSHAHGNDQHYLWWTSFDGKNWSPDTNTGYGTGGIPSLVVYNDRLYCIHEGYNSNGEFWWTSFDGQNWSPDTKTPYGTSGAPTVTLYNGKLYAFHEGHGRDGRLWWTGFDAQSNQWTAPSDTDTGFGITGVSAVVVGDKLYCLHQGRAQSGELWWFSYDGSQLSGDSQLSDHTTAGTPSLAQYNGEIYCAYEDSGYMSWTWLPLTNLWLDGHGPNAYVYSQLDSHATDHQQVRTTHTISIPGGATYLSAALIQSAQSADFPTGSRLNITGPDGTVYQQADQADRLVVMSGDSIYSLIVRNPQPGDWVITLQVPANVDFFCQLQTLPSQDVGDTMDETLVPIYPSSQLQKRDLTLLSMIGLAAISIAVNWFLSKKVSGSDKPLAVALLGATTYRGIDPATLNWNNIADAIRDLSTITTFLRMRLQLQGGRASAPYDELADFNMPSTSSSTGSRQIRLGRHHIIPLTLLIRFWNRLVLRGDIFDNRFRATGFLQNLQNAIPTYPLAARIRYNQTITLLRLITAPQTPDPNFDGPSALDDFAEIFEWLPGNIFIGPHPSLRDDDPGEGLDANAQTIVNHALGPSRFTTWQNIFDAITNYLTLTDNQQPLSDQALAQLRNATQGLNIIVRRRDVFPLDPSDWEETSPGRYRIRRPPRGA